MSHTTAEVRVLGRRIPELRGGEGPPLLYLHGTMGETMWLPHLAGLAERWTVHVPAHPGFGDAEGLDDIRDIEDLVFHYVAYLDAMGWQSVAVAGHSFGGWIAAELAARHPERVSRLVLAAAFGIRLPAVPMADIFVGDIRYPERMLDMLFHDTTCPAAQLMRSLIGLDVPDELLVDIIKARAATAKVGWNPLMHDPRLERLLPRVTARRHR